MAAFNATHKNLKVVLHLTPPNDDTSQLATAIRAGSVPDVVGLNDIDVPTFSHEHALMDLTPYVNALPYKASLSPGHLQARHHQRALLRAALPGRPVGALVQQEAVQGGRAQPERPADRLRADRGRFREDQRPGARHLRLLVRRQLPGLPRLHHAALAVGGGPAPDQRPARHPDGQRGQRRTAEDDAAGLPHHVGQARDARGRPDPERPHLGQGLRGRQGGHPARRLRVRRGLHHAGPARGVRRRAAARRDRRQLQHLRRRRRLRHPGGGAERRPARGSSSSGRWSRSSRTSTRPRA